MFGFVFCEAVWSVREVNWSCSGHAWDSGVGAVGVTEELMVEVGLHHGSKMHQSQRVF